MATSRRFSLVGHTCWMETKLPKLTVKQMRFCEEYVILGNAVQAYFQAFGSVGTNGVKRTYKSVARLTAKLMALPHIQDEIQAIQVASREHALVTLEELNQADVQAGFLDIAKFMKRVNGQITFLLPDELPPEVRRCVKKVRYRRRVLKGKDGDDSVEQIEHIEYDLIDPQRARESLAKRLRYDKPRTPLQELVAALSPELRARVWSELRMSGHPVGLRGQ